MKLELINKHQTSTSILHFIKQVVILDLHVFFKSTNNPILNSWWVQRSPTGFRILRRVPAWTRLNVSVSCPHMGSTSHSTLLPSTLLWKLMPCFFMSHTQKSLFWARFTWLSKYHWYSSISENFLIIILFFPFLFCNNCDLSHFPLELSSLHRYLGSSNNHCTQMFYTHEFLPFATLLLFTEPFLFTPMFQYKKQP